MPDSGVTHIALVADHPFPTEEQGTAILEKASYQEVHPFLKEPDEELVITTFRLGIRTHSTYEQGVHTLFSCADVLSASSGTSRAFVFRTPDGAISRCIVLGPQDAFSDPEIASADCALGHTLLGDSSPNL